MKINEFTQLDELFSNPNAKVIRDNAKKIQQGFMDYVKKNNLEGNKQDFVNYVNQQGMLGKAVQKLLGPDVSPQVDQKPTPGSKPNTQTPTQNKIAPLDQQLNDLTKQLRGAQPSPTGKIVPPKMMLDLQKNIQNAKLNKDWALKTGKFINSLIQKGYGGEELQKRHAEWLGFRKQKQMQSMYEDALTPNDINKLSMAAANDYHATQKDDLKKSNNKLGAFASGFRKGKDFDWNPFTRAADKFDQEQKGGDDKNDVAQDNKSRAGLKSLGFDDPNLAQIAMNRVQNGQALNSKQLAALAPIIGGLEKALADPAGRTRLKQLLQLTSK